MRKSAFTDKEILEILTQAETPVSPKDLCERYGVSVQTFYRWRRKYGARVQQRSSQRVKDLEEENARLKELVVEKELMIKKLRASGEKSRHH